MERLGINLQISTAQIKGQKGAVGLDEYGIGKISETYPVSEPSGTCLTKVGLRAVDTSLICSNEEHIHHCHGLTIGGESFGCLA